MRHPTLVELPPPPAGKTGWPWTDETPALQPTRPDSSAWPRISIVTPSYNQGQFIEETLRSVLLQGYPDLEYIIIDGGSRDQSVEIVKKYEPWLTYWVSEQDRGQSHAINKGFDRSTGLILGWLNSDDVLLPNALATVAVAIPRPEEPVVVAGKAEARDVSGNRTVWVVDRVPQTLSDLFSRLGGIFLGQPSVFFTRQALNLSGVLREDLHYAMDLDLWLRLARCVRITPIEQYLSWMRQHEDAKTWPGNALRLLDENEDVLKSYSQFVPAVVAKQTLGLARWIRSREWVHLGLSSLCSGDRKNAWMATYKAVRVRPLAIKSRHWIGLVLRLTLPRSVRRVVFGTRAGD